MRSTEMPAASNPFAYASCAVDQKLRVRLQHHEAPHCVVLLVVLLVILADDEPPEMPWDGALRINGVHEVDFTSGPLAGARCGPASHASGRSPDSREVGERAGSPDLSRLGTVLGVPDASRLNVFREVGVCHTVFLCRTVEVSNPGYTCKEVAPGWGTSPRICTGLCESTIQSLYHRRSGFDEGPPGTMTNSDRSSIAASTRAMLTCRAGSRLCAFELASRRGDDAPASDRTAAGRSRFRLRRFTHPWRTRARRRFEPAAGRR